MLKNFLFISCVWITLCCVADTLVTLDGKSMLIIK